MLFVNRSLTNFISQCDQILKELDTVNPPEMMGDCPSDDSSIVLGASLLCVLSDNFLPSVKKLQQEAQQINQVLTEKGFFSQINYRPHRPICTIYIDSYIRKTESEKRDFFETCFTKNALNYVRQEIKFMRKDARLLQDQTEKYHYPSDTPVGNCNFNRTSGIHASL